VFQQCDHLTVCGGGLIDPVVRNVVAVPILRPLRLQLRPVEEDAFPAHACLGCGGRGDCIDTWIVVGYIGRAKAAIGWEGLGLDRRGQEHAHEENTDYLQAL
jgi:hypothetical protein